MTKRVSAVLTAALVALGSPLVTAQVSAPGQSAGTAPPKSTALIVGQVVDGTTGQPIAEAIVTLGGGRGSAAATPQGFQVLPPGAGGRGPATQSQQRVMTGPDGRFVFHDLPPGPFQLSASLTGYTSGGAPNVPAGLTGSMAAAMTAVAALAAPSSAATSPVTLGEGEIASGVKLRLWKTGVVSGTVLDDRGDPAVGITVQVARRVLSRGRARYVPGSAARTDDRGAYRISSLAAGDYLVVVPQTQTSIPTAVMSGLMESLTGAGAPGGGLALMDMMSSGVNPTDAMTGGVRVGDYMVASSGSVPITRPDGRLQAYQTLFYPGVVAPAQASVVRLASGDERTNLDFHLRLIPTARVSGTATGPEGPIANLGIRLVVPADSAGSESEFDVATTVTTADGRFMFNGVPPGQFVLRAQKQPRPVMSPEMMANPIAQMMFGGAGTSAETEALYAVSTISVSETDVDGVALQLSNGHRATGRMVFESAAGRPAPQAAQMQSMTVTLTSADGRNLSPATAMGSPDRLSAQGEFRTKGYPPGKYFLSVSGTGNWQVKSATLDGRDVLDVPLEIANRDVDGIIVTVADEFARVSGTVSAADETDLSETLVVFFPGDYRGWIDAGMNPRRLRTVRAERTGRYMISNIPAGEYLAVALDRSREGDLQDPAFIQMLAPAGTRIVLATAPRALDVAKARVAP